MEVERLQSLCEEPLVGYHLESVVGIRHATGAKGIRPGDTLSLVREPDNPYDACAVRVDREGAKVGYVRGAFAKRLAVVMDNAMDQNDAVNANVSVRCMALDTPDEYDVKVALAYYTHEASHGLNGILRVGSSWTPVPNKADPAYHPYSQALESYQEALKTYKEAHRDDLPFKSAFRAALETSKAKYEKIRGQSTLTEKEAMLGDALDTEYKACTKGRTWLSIHSQ